MRERLTWSLPRDVATPIGISGVRHRHHRRLMRLPLVNSRCWNPQVDLGGGRLRRDRQNTLRPLPPHLAPRVVEGAWPCWLVTGTSGVLVVALLVQARLCPQGTAYLSDGYHYVCSGDCHVKVPARSPARAA